MPAVVLIGSVDPAEGSSTRTGDVWGTQIRTRASDKQSYRQIMNLDQLLDISVGLRE